MDVTGGATQQADELERVAVDRSNTPMRGPAAPEAGRSTAIGLPPHRLRADRERQVELAITHRRAERIVDRRNRPDNRERP